MYLHIDPQNGLAVYDQIVRQVKFAIADGAVRTGEMVPSIRELAWSWPSTRIRSPERTGNSKTMASWNRFAAPVSP